MRTPLRTDSPRSGSASKTRLLLALTVLAALSLLATACGSDDEAVDAGADAEQELPAEDAQDGSADELPADDDDDEPQDGDAAADDGSTDDSGYQLTESQPDMISAQAAPIDQLETIDDQTIAVRYQNGSEPCSLANVTVTESDTEVVVGLETGLHPNAAAMSCIAQVIQYEIQVTLAAPIGDRTIVMADA